MRPGFLAILLATLLAPAGRSPQAQTWKQVTGEQELPVAEMLDSVRDRATYLNGSAGLIREARAAVAGMPACPGSASDMDCLVDAPEDGIRRIFCFKKGSAQPCATVEGRSARPGKAWEFKVLAENPPLPQAAPSLLGMIRAVRKEVDRLLGPGVHVYVPLPLQEGDYTLIYGWAESQRFKADPEREDGLLVGSMVLVGVVPLIEKYSVQDIFILESGTLSWNVGGVKRKAPFGIRSAQVFEALGIPTECDFLRCKTNQDLCPRLFKGQKGCFLVQGDGSWRKLSDKEAAKVSELDPGLLPKPYYRNEDLETLRDHRRFVRPPGEAAPPKDGAPGSSEPEKALPDPPPEPSPRPDPGKLG